METKRKSNIFLVGTLFLSAFILSQATAHAGGDAKKGATVYNGVCVSCHGENGETEVPGIPVFAKGERMEKTDAQLTNSVKNGLSNPNNPSGMIMAPFGGGPRLDDKQIADVIAYIRTLKKK